jgi:hypothetical protein
MVQAVLAAFAEVGRVTRSLLGSKRGSVVLLLGRDEFDVASDEDEDDVDVEALSSPN